MEDIRATLANNLASLMKKHGHSQADLARKSGVSQTMIGKILRQEASATVPITYKLEHAYGLALGRLLMPSDYSFDDALLSADMLACTLENYPKLNTQAKQRVLGHLVKEDILKMAVRQMPDKDLNTWLHNVMVEKLRRAGRADGSSMRGSNIA